MLSMLKSCSFYLSAYFLGSTHETLLWEMRKCEELRLLLTGHWAKLINRLNKRWSWLVNMCRR